MSARSAVVSLPAALRAELDQRLVGGGFQGYEALSQWLSTAGYQISKSALHRYGSALEEDFERTMASVRATQALARAYDATQPDDGAALTGATVRVMQDSLLRIAMTLRDAQEAEDADPARIAKLLPSLSRALADLGRLDISREKWGIEREREIARTAAAALAERASADGGPVTPARLREIAAEIYGV